MCMVDAGERRAAFIPLTRNHAGFPDGVTGTELLARMRAHAEKDGAKAFRGQVDAIDRDDDMFVVHIADQTVAARTALLTAGVVNRRPPGMADTVCDDAATRGPLRSCPTSDR
jgi:thioredoxin reductase (NADPH)